MKKIVIGFLAHVDSGKTTLSEQVLFKSGVIRKLGRVDHKDAFLDSDAEEKERGITIYSKEARFSMGKTRFTLIDTPGHKDFEDEMKKSLSVLDYAVLIISSIDGVQLQTKRIIELLDENMIPTFIFINKMDRNDVTEKEAFDKVKEEIKNAYIAGKENSYEMMAELDDDLMEEYLESGTLSEENIKTKIRDRKIFPVYFGSALKDIGIDEFLSDLDKYTLDLGYDDRKDKPLKLEVFKTDSDQKGNLQIHAKITAGTLRVKDIINGEKVNEIRLYTGKKYDGANEALPGDLVTITGLKNLDGLGIESEAFSKSADFSLDTESIIEPTETSVSWDDMFSGSETEEEKQAAVDRYRYGDKESKNEEKNLDAIFLKTYGKSKRDEQVLKANQSKRSRPDPKEVVNFPQANWKEDAGKKPTYYILDGYNVIFQWEDLKNLAEKNIDAAREAFIEIMMNYRAFKESGMLIVFDGYKVKGSPGSEETYGELKVVYTRERETADRYIEEVTFASGKKLDVTVVTSDQMVQMAAFGDGARRISSREFIADVLSTSEEIRNLIKTKCIFTSTKIHF